MKDEHTNGKKMARNGRNTVIYKGTFISNHSLPYFFVTVIVTVIMILAMFIFYFCLKQQDKHCIRHYDCDYDKKIRYKYGPNDKSTGKVLVI